MDPFAIRSRTGAKRSLLPFTTANYQCKHVQMHLPSMCHRICLRRVTSLSRPTLVLNRKFQNKYSILLFAFVVVVSSNLVECAGPEVFRSANGAFAELELFGMLYASKFTHTIFTHTVASLLSLTLPSSLQSPPTGMFTYIYIYIDVYTVIWWLL